jgi:2-iminobutanoate/2-iminopropanoate deaminase
MVLKTTVYLLDLGQTGRMNDAYAKFFGDRPPACATIQVACLPGDARVEIDIIAEA